MRACCLLLQPFFKGGFQGIGDSAPYFDENTQLALLGNHLIKQAVPQLTYESALLSWQIFATVSGEQSRCNESLAVTRWSEGVLV